MRKLCFYVARCLDDSSAYDIRARTLREVKARLMTVDPASYGQPERVEIPYRSVFDLMEALCGEGKAY